MNLTLDERRATLREAVKSDDHDDYAPFQAALAGASEDERGHLAKTLPASRLFKHELGSRRSAFVLTALGTPKVILKTLADEDRYVFDQTNRGGLIPEMVAGFVAGTLTRDDAYIQDLLVALYEIEHGALGWAVARAAYDELGLRHDSVEYLNDFIYRVAPPAPWSEPDERDAATKAAALADALQSDPAYLDHEFWALFRTEGAGATFYYDNGAGGTAAWLDACVVLSDRIDGFRDRLLDATLAGQLRDFSAAYVVTYHRLHRGLNPTNSEVVARQSTYRALLTASPSPSVGLAQDLLRQAVAEPSLDRTTIVEASDAVLLRKEKKLRKAQLALLTDIVAAEPELAETVDSTVRPVVDDLPAELQKLARKLISERESSADNPPSVPADRVPPPRTAALPIDPTSLPPLDSDDELFELVASLAEGSGLTGDVIRVTRHIATHPTPEDRPDALIARLRKLHARIEEVRYGPEGPLQRFTSTVLTWLGADIKVPDFNGGPEVQTLVDGRYLRHRSHSPYTLLMDQFVAATGGGEIVDAPIPRRSATWRRELHRPRQLGFIPWTPDTELPFWLDDAPTPGDDSAFADLALDVRDIRREAVFAGGYPSEAPGFRLLGQWSAWIYRANLDTLATHAHPALIWLTEQKRADGAEEVLEAIGANRYPPAGPTYSALALAMAAQTPEHRALAAESVARLCENNLLDPDSFGTEIAAHLSDGFIKAGRIAQSLHDAATISPATGYRITQTLAALLPQLPLVTGAAKLVELLAQLVTDYGVAVVVPEHLQPKTNGSSVMAIALRSLADSTDHQTELRARAAAELGAVSAEHGA